MYDDEFSQCIEHHKERRPADWQIVEVSFNLAATLNIYANPNNFIIVDCLTSKQ